ncbi:MAG: pyridoxamine kinase [Clostridia bacterium]|nr:pyridoxamine kinase [Clostridia bacterium]
MKRVFAIHDMSGIGKCSLTAAIPIISAAGAECNPIPTAVLSSHTGNISGYTFRDLTDDLYDYIAHWKKIGIRPDTIYSGYLGSGEQIEFVASVIRDFSDEKTLVIVDPAMADSGVLYTGFDVSFADKIKKLCSMADVITPNLTEACILTGIGYREDYDESYIASLIDALSLLTGRYVILTGVSDKAGMTGCCVYDSLNSDLRYFSSEKCDGVYYGTGDVFSSVLTALMTNGINIFESAEKAVEFTYKAVHETYIEGTDTRLGIAFEKFLGDLIREE